MKPTLRIAISAGLSLLMTTWECNAQAAADPVPEDRPGTPAPLADAPLAEYQNRLLELAFETATAIRVNPHIKNRSRAQQAVVETCLELDQPQRALGFIESIDNWRRGAGYGELAFYCAKRGYPAEAKQYIELGDRIAGQTEDWRRDRIRVSIAKTYAWLGQTRQADRFQADLVDSETGKVLAVEAAVGDEDSFDQQVEELDRLIALGSFDITRNALGSYVELFDRFCEDPVRSSQVGAKVEAASTGMPVFFRIEILGRMAEIAIDHGQQARPLELVNRAQALLDGHQWRLEHLLPRAARLIELRFRAGDTDRARADADAAMALYAEQGEQVVNIYRAGALRPLAEAYQSMGDAAAAHAVYLKAVVEGAVNPNPKPRAEDLSATCCSMALHGVEPDAKLWGRMRQVSAGLRARE